MNLTRKTYLAIVGIVVFTVLIFYLISRPIMENTFVRLENREAGENVRRVVNALNNERHSLQAVTTDYAGWDETYKFAVGQNPGYPETQLSEDTFSYQRLNVLMIINNQNRIVLERGYDLEKKCFVPVPPALKEHFDPQSTLLTRGSVNAVKSGIIVLPGGPMMVCIHPILTSEYRGPAHGTLVMGRYLTRSELKRLNYLTINDFRLTNLSAVNLPVELLRDLKQGKTVIRALGEDRLAGYRIYKDIYGKDALLLTVEQNRPIYNQGKKLIDIFILLIIVIGMLTPTVLSSLVLSRLILRRLKRLAQEIRTVGNESDLSLRVVADSEDEIGQLAVQINHLLESLECSHRALAESEARYRAIVEDNTEMIGRFSQDGTITFANEAFARFAGLNATELIGTRVQDTVFPEAKHTLTEIVKSLTPDQPVVIREFQLRRPDGRTHWHRWAVRAIYDEKGNLMEYQGVGQDITENKKAEEQIRLNQLRMETLLRLYSMTDASMQELIKFAMEEGGRLTRSPVGFVAWPNEEETELNILIWSREVIETCPVKEPAAVRLHAMGLFEETLKKRRSLVINDFGACAQKKTVMPDWHIEIKRLMAIPVFDGDRMLALVVAANKEEDYDDSDLMQVELMVSGMLRILQRRMAEDALRRSERRLQRQVNYLNTLIDNMSEVLMTYDKNEIVTFVNKKVIDYWGMEPQAFIGHKVQDLIPASAYQEVKEAIERRLKLGVSESYEFQLEIGRRPMILRINSSPIINEGVVTGGLVLMEDITERKKVEQQLLFLSMHDPLTGLYNRTYFEEEMRRLDNERYNPVGIIMCDVDGLKLVNDTLGHSTGDIMLQTAAAEINRCFRAGDVVARVGGDEFAIIVPNCGRHQVEEFCQRIRSAIEEYNSVHTRLPLSVSLGFAVREDMSISLPELFREADNNMYREKLHSSRSARAAIVQTLMKALEARDFITEGHADRLQELVVMLGQAVGMKGQKLTDLRLFAQFHDIGKVGIPDRILFKPGRLTPEETEEMRRHSEIGHRIALAAPDLAPIADWILKHHEWWNGQGYPLGLSGEEIPLECRILAIADAYDAMTSDRPYRKAMSHEEAIMEIEKGAGTQFDPALAEKFIEIVNNTDEWFLK